ncbi:MAG: Macrolide export protein MacA [Pseudomonadales bacterium]|nr:Macrolide export protein MacA [Pseudomonadales bacterium]
MNFPRIAPRAVVLVAALLTLLVLFGYVALRSGPLAPVPVTITTVESRAITPALFGVGTVEARRVHRIGPTAPGRIAELAVDVGERVRAGQTLGAMDAVDLEARIAAQDAALLRAAAIEREAVARHDYARSQLQRYERLFVQRSVSEEVLTAKRQEMAIADAARAAARGEVARVRADGEALRAQRANLRLLSPVDGLVVVRSADSGTTLVAGQVVFEIIDTASVWIDVRFDQSGAAGLAPGLPARIVLRSSGADRIAGRVLRVEPVADAVTEELLAKIVFDAPPPRLPALGELAEVTVELGPLPEAPVVPNAALRRGADGPGVWRLGETGVEFVRVTPGRGDLDGLLQVESGVQPGDRIVVHSARALGARSRLRVVDEIARSAR